MRTLYSSRSISIPENVTMTIKARAVHVEGPLGALDREFKHMSLDMTIVEADGKKSLKVDIWFGNRENVASLRTVTSHIENMITGVTQGFKYIMRAVYSHFPINVSMVKDGNNEVIEIRNFLGDKRVRRVKLHEGVKYVKNADVKDCIEISGIDITKVSLSCALLSQACNIRKKDLRKFLDGMYVSKREAMVEA
jgi:large subunit ribosomal protein L9e